MWRMDQASAASAKEGPQGCSLEMKTPVSFFHFSPLMSRSNKAFKTNFRVLCSALRANTKFECVFKFVTCNNYSSLIIHTTAFMPFLFVQIMLYIMLDILFYTVIRRDVN